MSPTAVEFLPSFAEFSSTPELTDDHQKALVNRYEAMFGKRRRAFHAFDGALVIFGWGRLGNPVIDVAWHSVLSPFTGHYDLPPDALVFGCDVYGDLLWEQEGKVYRLDGENGNSILLMDRSSDLIGKLHHGLGAEFGGKLAKQNNLAVDEVSIMRLMPSRPYSLAGPTPESNFQAPLLRTLSMKMVLSSELRELPDGAPYDYSYWRP